MTLKVQSGGELWKCGKHFGGSCSALRMDFLVLSSLVVVPVLTAGWIFSFGAL